jgi:replication initiation and membrane attachment protein DnaB
MEKGMMKRFSLIALLVVVCWTVAQAQNRIVDVLANKIIQKYQQSSCEELAKQKSEPKSPKEQEVIQMLRNDPQLRTAFINKVAAPVANKMFECGMIP